MRLFYAYDLRPAAVFLVSAMLEGAAVRAAYREILSQAEREKIGPSKPLQRALNGPATEVSPSKCAPGDAFLSSFRPTRSPDTCGKAVTCPLRACCHLSERR